MNRKLDVGNLAPTTDLRELRELFSQAGQVAALTVVRDDISGRVQRMAYLEMESHDGARAAVARFDQYPFRGKRLTVRERPSGITDAARRIVKTGVVARVSAQADRTIPRQVSPSDRTIPRLVDPPDRTIHRT